MAETRATTEDPSGIQHSTRWDGRVSGSSTEDQSYGEERFVPATPLSPHVEDGQLMTPTAVESTTDDSARNLSNPVERPVFPLEGGHIAPPNPAEWPTLQAEWKAQLFADRYGSMQFERALS